MQPPDIYTYLHRDARYTQISTQVCRYLHRSAGAESDKLRCRVFCVSAPSLVLCGLSFVKQEDYQSQCHHHHCQDEDVDSAEIKMMLLLLTDRVDINLIAVCICKTANRLQNIWVNMSGMRKHLRGVLVEGDEGGEVGGDEVLLAAGHHGAGHWCSLHVWCWRCGHGDNTGQLSSGSLSTASYLQIDWWRVRGQAAAAHRTHRRTLLSPHSTQHTGRCNV